MGDEFIQIQEKIEAVLTLLKSTSDTEVRRTYLLEFRTLLAEADKLLLIRPSDEKSVPILPIRKMTSS